MKRVLLLLGLAACSPRVVGPEVAPAPTGSGVSVIETVPGPKTPDDPRVVRCGVDDGPTNVISGSLDDGGGSRAKRMLADRAMPPPPSAGAAASPMPIQRRPPPPPQGPKAQLAVGTAHDMAGGALDPVIVQAARSLQPGFETCLPLSTDADVGEQSIQVAVAASGEPLWVLPTLPSQPTQFGRCLLEHSCRFKVPGSYGARSVWVPVKTTKEAPLPPPTPRPTVNVRVIMESPKDERGEGGRAILEASARACGGQVRAATETRFSVRFSAARNAEIATSAPGGGAAPMDALAACTVAQIQARMAARPKPETFVGVVRWDP